MKSTSLGAIRHGVPVLGYCVSSNHVHVVIHAEAQERRCFGSDQPKMLLAG